MATCGSERLKKPNCWRKAMTEDAVHRANRWQMFYEEDGGLRETLNTLRQAYFDRAADLMPNDTAQLLKLGMASKIVDQIEATFCTSSTPARSSSRHRITPTGLLGFRKRVAAFSKFLRS
jgi:hypothetical protein